MSMSLPKNERASKISSRDETRSSLKMKSEIPEPHPHVPQPIVGDGDRQRQSQHRVRKSKRIDVAEPPEHGNEKQAANESRRNQNRIWDMHQRKKTRGQKQGSPIVPDQVFEPAVEKRIQDELLLQRPYG